MTDFKPGDPVEYVGNTTAGMVGKRGTVVDPLSPNPSMVWFDHGGDEPYGAYSYNLRLITPAPDVLTIPRAELPEVAVEPNGLYIIHSMGVTYPGSHTAKSARSNALGLLAVSEFLAAREKAEQDAADQHAAILNKRRDELAVEVAKAAGFIDFLDFTYKEHPPLAQAAINMLIERDGKAQK